MQYSSKVVTHLPLNIIWSDEGMISEKRGQYLNQAAIQKILRQNSAAFVIADIGKKLEWIGSSECYSFWKKNKKHIADPLTRFYLDQYPNEYVYLASEWTGTHSTYIILLEKIH